MVDQIVTIVANSYLEAALWSSFDCDDSDNSAPLDKNYGSNDWSNDAISEACADCRRFLELLQETDCDGFDNLLDAAIYEQGENLLGHDFWLTRNGHGAGFWDGDYGKYGDAICKVLYDEFGRYSEVDVYADDDGELRFL